MTPDKMQTFRIKLTNELWMLFPRAGAAAIWQAVNVLMPLILRESFNLVDLEHAKDCACWNCVRNLNADVIESMARWRVAQEAADDHD